MNTPVVIVVTIEGGGDRFAPCLGALRAAFPSERMVVVAADTATGVDSLADRFDAVVSSESFPATVHRCATGPTARRGRVLPTRRTSSP